MYRVVTVQEVVAKSGNKAEACLEEQLTRGVVLMQDASDDGLAGPAAGQLGAGEVQHLGAVPALALGRDEVDADL
jgi:hypothetical protein